MVQGLDIMCHGHLAVDLSVFVDQDVVGQDYPLCTVTSSMIQWAERLLVVATLCAKNTLCH